MMTRYRVFTLQTRHMQPSPGSRPAKPNANTMLDRQTGCLHLPPLRQQPLKPPPVVYHRRHIPADLYNLETQDLRSSRHSNISENEYFIGVNKRLITYVRSKTSRW